MRQVFWTSRKTKTFHFNRQRNTLCKVLRAFEGKPYTIKFSNDLISLNPSVQKTIVFHELLHLNIYAKLKGASSTSIDLTIPGYHEFSRIWGQNQNEIHHEIFARDYLDSIKSFIQTAAPDLDADKAKWGSLIKTNEFFALPYDQRESIKIYLEANNLH